ncbi:hypothetical protein [Haloarchaeobius sp. TZWWS8]|uniref:hypothetical protein n=1 Tax=Haloarchaeobius sp. TZWWS8 TaxID=3446121 RepID=UPI003EC104BC
MTRDGGAGGRTGLFTAVGSTVASWVALGLLLVQAVASMVGPSPALESLPPELAAEVGATRGTFDRVVDVLLLDVGRSFTMAPDESAWSVVGTTVADTGTLVVLALVLAALVAMPLVLLARQGNELAGRIAGYVGALPTHVWSFAFFALVVNDVVQFPRRPIPADPLSMAVPALVLALPLGTGLAGLLVRDESLAGGRRQRLLEGSLRASWFVGAVVVVENLFGVSGLGYLWIRALGTGDVPVFVAATLSLTLPLLFLGLVRDLVWTLLDDGERGSTATGRRPTQADGGVSAVSLRSIVAADSRVRAGLVSFVLALVVGLVGAVATTRPQERVSSGFEPSLLTFDLSAVALVTLVGVLVGGVGLSLGVEAHRSGPVEGIVQVLTAPVLNVPLLLVAVLSLGWTGLLTTGDVLQAELLVALVAGIALAGAAARLTARGLTVYANRSLATVAGAGWLARAGSVLAFVVADLLVVGGLPGHVGRSLVVRMDPVGGLAAALVAVTWPAVSLLVVGNGLLDAAVER